MNMPVILKSERDSGGRLVGLEIGSARQADADHVWLLALDPSAHALRAAAAVCRLAQKAQTSPLVEIINIQPWMSLEAAENGLAQRALQDTHQGRAKLDEVGLDWRLHVVMGEPVAGILAAIDQLQPQGLVLGRRGLNMAQTLFLGSVTQGVLQQSPVPVLVVP